MLPAAEIVATARRQHNASTLMQRAIEFGHVDVVRLLLDGGFEPNTDWGSDTALFSAARCGQPEIARLLLERGADPFIENERGGTALTFAATRAVAEAICTYRRGAAAEFSRIPFPRDFREIGPRTPMTWRGPKPPPPRAIEEGFR